MVATAPYCPLPERRYKYQICRRRVGAGAHGNDPAPFQQLVIESFDYRRHFSKNSAENDEQIRLARRASYHFGTETGDVMTAGKCSHHFYLAARKTKIKRPDRIGLSPGNHIFKPGEQKIAPQRFFVRLLPRFLGGIVLDSGQMPMHKFHLSFVVGSVDTLPAGAPIKCTYSSKVNQRSYQNADENQGFGKTEPAGFLKCH